MDFNHGSRLGKNHEGFLANDRVLLLSTHFTTHNTVFDFVKLPGGMIASFHRCATFIHSRAPGMFQLVFGLLLVSASCTIC